MFKYFRHNNTIVRCDASIDLKDKIIVSEIEYNAYRASLPVFKIKRTLAQILLNKGIITIEEYNEQETI